MDETQYSKNATPEPVFDRPSSGPFSRPLRRSPSPMNISTTPERMRDNDFGPRAGARRTEQTADPFARIQLHSNAQNQPKLQMPAIPPLPKPSDLKSAAAMIDEALFPEYYETKEGVVFKVLDDNFGVIR